MNKAQIYQQLSVLYADLADEERRQEDHNALTDCRLSVLEDREDKLFDTISRIKNLLNEL